MAHPCCGLSLRHGTIIVAIFDIASAVMGVFVSVLSLIFLTCFREIVIDFLQNENFGDFDGKEVVTILNQMGGLILLVVAACLLAALLQLALATYLYKGARERDASGCQLWWKIKVILFILAVVFMSGVILLSQTPAQHAIASVLVFVYQVYALWVVQAFIDEIRFGRKLQDQSQPDTAQCYA
ncbi:hypothetical protein Ocin01_15516 [Orchesella cincta]|uniref:Uncharacterized protein n=1 Tax=Orchesella cincta TaxID=48709 RepID=A0A1D2MDU7_ORCCI|nr:hypothetical protein Ocin01_15516 [Orchesella cincta]